MPFFILFINFILKKNAIAGVAWLNLQSKSSQLSVLQTLIFFLTFINQGLAILLINAHFGFEKMFGVLGGIDGDYSDFSDGWFREISYLVITPMILTQFGPLISNSINYLWYEWYGLLDRNFTNRKLYFTKTDSPLSYCEVNYGATLPLFTKYPFMMNIICLSMLYSLGIPFISILTLSALFISYVFEKIAIFWHVKAPPLMDDQLSQNTIRYLKWASFMYPVIGFWLVTNKQMFANVVDNKKF